VPVKLSGEYSKLQSVLGFASANSLIFKAPLIAISFMPFLS
jgi:hypothetical protein